MDTFHITATDKLRCPKCDDRIPIGTAVECKDALMSDHIIRRRKWTCRACGPVEMVWWRLHESEPVNLTGGYIHLDGQAIPVSDIKWVPGGYGDMTAAEVMNLMRGL